MKDKIALILLLLWPIIPIFWTIVHGFPKIIKKIKLSVYPAVFFITLIIDFILFHNRDYLFSATLSLNQLFVFTGYILFASGLLLQIWTLLLLSLPGITGVPEIKDDKDFDLVIKGPFSIIRHPTYLAHTLILLGAFLFTSYIILLIITVLDFLLNIFIIIPLEERELINRMGEKYKNYKRKVKWKLIPYIF
ncbi:MAG: isoprenylcysteine carboxylmethyltransferase family protein [Proteobacteria bacterium]|nr:isoprenylcysteine carboxylmethyltransferase family protein [Pseudomonadota bacterium]